MIWFKQFVQHIYDFEGDKTWAAQCVAELLWEAALPMRALSHPAAPTQVCDRIHLYGQGT